jgi:D-3-phosphoglycerate dehydrogenase
VVFATHGNPNIIVDMAAATKAGVLVAHAPARNDVTVAEVAVAFMVLISRHLVQGHEWMMAGEWVRPDPLRAFFTFMGTELENRTAGLVGFGNIARQVCKRLRAFDMNVVAYDPYLSAEAVAAAGAKKVSLDELLKTSDFVSMHVHVTPETKGMIGTREFALMKPTAYLINTGRAGAVDEQAMIDALTNKRIAGAALDVHHKEPLPVDHPLMKLSNVVLTPHIAGTTVEMVRRHSAIAERNLAAIKAGLVPPNLFNKDVLTSTGLRWKPTHK